MLPHTLYASILTLILPLAIVWGGSTETVRPDGSRLWLVKGLDAGRVYQRNEDGAATFAVAGQVGYLADQLAFRVMRRNQLVRNFDWSALKLDDRRGWSLNASLPTGGPYRFEFRLLDKEGETLDYRTIGQIWVGDLWLLAGQSNMDGHGELDSPWAQRPSEGVRYFSLADEWSVAEDPLHFCYEANYPAYLTSYNPSSPSGRSPIEHQTRGAWPDWVRNTRARGMLGGTGLGLPFGRRIYETVDVPIGLVLCSLGGTTMEQWSPALKDRGGESLYGAMIQRLEKVGGQVTGVLWWQGESDHSSGGYREKLEELIRSLRRDADRPQLPFYIVQLGPQNINDASPAERNRVREMQRQVAEQMSSVELVTAIDQNLSSSAHFDAEGYTRIGRRLANIALTSIYGVEQIQKGPCLQRVVRDREDSRRLCVIFDRVNSALSPDQGVAGFSIRTTGGASEAVRIVESRIDASTPNQVILVAHRAIPVGAELWYGYGWMPEANVVDEKDMALAAFGPVVID